MNFKGLASDLDLEEEEFIELVEVFLEVSASDLTKMESALSSGASEQVIEAAHSIKGAAGGLGFSDAQALAATIEMNARNHVLEGTLKGANAIKGNLAAITEALKKNEPGSLDDPIGAGT